jgi:hypothetical protein
MSQIVALTAEAAYNGIRAGNTVIITFDKLFELFNVRLRPNDDKEEHAIRLLPSFLAQTRLDNREYEVSLVKSFQFNISPKYKSPK